MLELISIYKPNAHTGYEEEPYYDKETIMKNMNKKMVEEKAKVSTVNNT